jgi:Flp pilus assembly protein TadD
MGSRFNSASFVAFVAIGFLFLGAVVARSSGEDATAASGLRAKVTIDYPLDGSIFPPEITPPTFLWRDGSGRANNWMIEFSFADRSKIRVETAGEGYKVGELDPIAGESEELKLTAEQAATRTWKPEPETWERIKRNSTKSPVTISFTGFADSHPKQAVSSGKVTISTSTDPVGAPIFYRDVPLMTVPHTEKGSIQPLPTSALPLIEWKIRNIAETKSRVVMGNVYTCANCHSFSSDGKTLGLDVDGSLSDKGLYALVDVGKNTAIRKQDVIRWSAFQVAGGSTDPSTKRFGVMSQVSPDGRYVVTSIAPPALENAPRKGGVPELAERLYATNYMDVRFTQVFYPTRGVLVWYDRKANTLKHLPGADDPQNVQTSAFWSPDSKYLIFSRAKARNPYPPVPKKAEHANDPNETQIQYDLYRIPFNEGRGGKAEPVIGASANGMSNNFPKVSPDGRWIVYVQNRNALLMRPDSKLYIVPFEGGTPRLMNCNTSLMNSWHSFSPNGRWLAFSSKGRTPYTRLMLTHIDKDGNDSPAIVVDNTTAANRAVNIPEFVNISPDGIENIEPQAMEFYKVANKAYEAMERGNMGEAIQQWRKALELDPDDARAHFLLGSALSASNQEAEAVDEYRRACELDPSKSGWFAHLGVSLALTGDADGSIANYRKALELDPTNAGIEADLGAVLFQKGQAQEGYEHLKKAVELAPDSDYAHSHLGTALLKMGRLDEAVSEFEKTVALSPTSAEYHLSLGFARGLRGDFTGAVTALQNAVELSEGKQWQPLSALAYAQDKLGHHTEALRAARQALAVGLLLNDPQLERKLRDDLNQYERNSANAPPK